MPAPPSRTMRELPRADPAKSVRHDYSTSTAGTVPLDERRTRYHFLALWTTLAAGFTFLFLGFQFHDYGYSLGKAVSAGALGGLPYLLFALPAAYLGSTTGHTPALPTPPVFREGGAPRGSLLLVGVPAG